MPPARASLKLHRAFALAGALWAVALAHAQFYWDINGNTNGAGGASPSGTWSTSSSDKNWSTNSAGNAGGSQKWTNGNTAVFSAGTDATGSYTITVSGTVGTSGITIEEGTVAFTGGTINFSDATPDFIVGSGLTTTVGSAITGSNGLTKSGAGTLIFDSTAKTYTGTTSITAGTLQLNASNVINDASALSVSSGATFLLNWGVSETVGALSGAGTIDYRTGTFTTNTASATTFSGVLQNTYGTFVKEGTGTLTLSGANTYSGITNINAGTLVAASDTALGTSTWGNTISSGAALQLQGNINLTEGQFSVSGTGVSNSGAIANLSGSNTLNAAIDLAGNTRIGSAAGTLDVTGQISTGNYTLTTAGAGNITLSGSVNGSGALTHAGSGTLTLSGSGGNSFSGALSVNDGTVVLAKTAGTNATGGGAINIGDGVGAAGSAVLRLDASNQIADYGGVVTIAADGLLNVNNFSESVNSIAGTGRIDLGSTGSLTIGINSGSSTFGGTILGTGTFAQAGSGSFTLTNSLNFAGEYQLQSGSLLLSGHTLTAQTFHVTGNATIDFAGGNSMLDVVNFVIDSGVTLTLVNWIDCADYFYAEAWSGAVFDTRGVNPMNQLVFQGQPTNATQWQSYDSQITPVPEPSTYGALLLLGAFALTGVRHLRRV